MVSFYVVFTEVEVYAGNGVNHLVIVGGRSGVEVMRIADISIFLKDHIFGVLPAPGAKHS